MELSQQYDHNMANKMPKQEAMEHSQIYNQNLSNKMVKREMCIPIDDIVMIILNRLPSTSILRFQTVCKHWCFLIRSYILKAHSKRSLMSVQFTNIDFGKLTFLNFDDEGKITKTVCDINIGAASDYALSNVVNGFTCAYGDEAGSTFCLINLTTLEASKRFHLPYHDNIILGLDSSTGLYKFVRIYSHYDSRDSYHCEILGIIDSFKSKWKKIGEVPHKVNIDNPIYLDGAIHWMMKPRSSDKRKSLDFDILKLDMKKERFDMIAPILENEYDNCDCQICDFSLSEEKGRLYVLHYCCKGKYLEGWRLKESKRDCVWNVVFHVNFAAMIGKEQGGLIGNDEHRYLVATEIVDGKVLIQSKRNERFYIRYDTGVYIYDLVHKKLTEHKDVYGGSFRFEKGLRRRISFHRRDV